MTVYRSYDFYLALQMKLLQVRARNWYNNIKVINRLAMLLVTPTCNEYVFRDIHVPLGKTRKMCVLFSLML